MIRHSWFKRQRTSKNIRSEREWERKRGRRRVEKKCFYATLCSGSAIWQSSSFRFSRSCERHQLIFEHSQFNPMPYYLTVDKLMDFFSREKNLSFIQIVWLSRWVFIVFSVAFSSSFSTRKFVNEPKYAIGIKGTDKLNEKFRFTD